MDTGPGTGGLARRYAAHSSVTGGQVCLAGAGRSRVEPRPGAGEPEGSLQRVLEMLPTALWVACGALGLSPPRIRQ